LGENLEDMTGEDPASDAIDVTKLLQRWQAGDKDAATALLPLVYRQLRRIAGNLFRGERATHTLQPTAVVHEAYLSLCRGHSIAWRDREHFFAIMARIMRRVLIDHARQRGRIKRGGGLEHLDLDAAEAEPASRWRSELTALDDALSSLARLDPRKAAITELHYFGGLTVAETAQALGISDATIGRELRCARAWLCRELSREG
jgi:RNA polymerase sigma factor (TIGR02999 family)